MQQTVVEAAEQILRESPYHQLRELKCEFRDGILILRGQLPSLHLKQLAQTVVQELDSVATVQNHIEVLWERMH